MKPIIIQNLNHYFGKDKLTKQALFDINLEIKAGEIVIMTGPSGSGKTTLLSLLGGLRKVQSGSLQTLGQELFQAKETDLVNIRRKIGYIFQAHNLLPFLTAQQNVQMSLELEPKIKSRQAAKIAAEILANVGLQERLHYFPEKLSGGQKQRVAIARALASRPKLVLADEPTAALDSKTGREIVNIMHRLVKEQNSTILLVTHDNRILDIADRIIHMEDGRLVNTETKSSRPQLYNLQNNYQESIPELVSVANGVENHFNHQNHQDSPSSKPQNNIASTRDRFNNNQSLQQTSLFSDSQDYSEPNKNNSANNSQNFLSSYSNSSLTPQNKDKNPHLSAKKTRYNIVCIDDSTTILKSIAAFLDHEIFNVISIDNPLEALIETIKSEPDIVLLDIMMPNINGHEFCTLLRQNKKFQNTPIIIITSLNNPIDRELAKSNGASDYLAKPFNKTDLLKTLFKFL